MTPLNKFNPIKLDVDVLNCPKRLTPQLQPTAMERCDQLVFEHSETRVRFNTPAPRTLLYVKERTSALT